MRLSPALKGLDDFLALYVFVFRNSTQDGIQRPDPKGLVGWNREALVGWFLGFQYDVAAFLMNNAIALVAA